MLRYLKPRLTSVYPFVVLELPEEHFNALHTEVASGHHAVETVGESTILST